MDEGLKNKERELERLSVEEEVESKRVSIAQKKALEREAKRKYGRDWKKVLGVVRSLKPDREVVQDLYGMGLGGEELRNLSRPGGGRE